MKPGDLVRIKRGCTWKYESAYEWARTRSPLLVLKSNHRYGGDYTIKICNKENLWVPKKYFEVISAGR